MSFYTTLQKYIGTPYTTTIGAVFRKAMCPVLHLRALVHNPWHKAGIPGGKDGCSFTILVFIKKLPSQCYGGLWCMFFFGTFSNGCVITFSLSQLSWKKCGSFSLNILKDQMNKTNNCKSGMLLHIFPPTV